MSVDTEARLETLLALVHELSDAVITMEANGRLVAYNRAAEAMFQYSADEVRVGGIELLMHERDQEHHDSYVSNYLESGKARIIGLGREVQCQRKDGSTFLADLSISETQTASGHYFTAILRDLSERESYREEIVGLNRDLQRSAMERAAILRYAPIGIVTMAANGRIVAANRAIERIAGYSESSLIGQRGIRFIHADEQPTVMRAFQGLTSMPESYSSSVHQIRATDGEYRPVRTFNAAIQVSSNARPMLICMIEDLSERVAQAEELKTQRERLAHVARLTQMGEMAAMLAHELNQPLAAIANYAGGGARLLESSSHSLTKLRSVLKRIGAQADHAGQVIRKVRSLTRQHETEKSLVSVSDLISDLMSLIEIDIRYSGIQLKLDTVDDLFVMVDHVQIEQVVLNLLRNAIDAVRALPEERKSILVRVFSQDDTAVFEVHDSGEGVSEALQRSLFDPFVTNKPNGMGMGLSISKTIIDTHEGTIGFRSRKPTGSVFWFRLPLFAIDRDPS